MAHPTTPAPRTRDTQPATTARSARSRRQPGRLRPRLCALAAAALLAGAAWAQQPAVPIDIAAQPLDKALAALARQTGARILFSTDLTENKQAPAVKATLTPQQALERLLAGSGLVLKALPDGGFTVAPQAAPGRDETTLPVVKVTASAQQETATSPVSGFVAKRSATGTKTDTPIIETPQSISVIGRDEIDARGALTLEETVRYTPGVTVNFFGVDNRGYEFLLLRGFDGTSASYRDGLSQASFSDVIGLTETYGIERVEVLRGPSSMIFGRGDAGGIINRTSKLPTGDALREVEVQYGSFDRNQLGFDVGDRVNDDGSLAFRVVGLGLKSNSNNAQYPNGDALKNERFYLAPSLRWRPTAATSFTVLAEVLKNKSADDIWYLADPDGQRTNLNEGDPNYSQLQQKQMSIGYQFEHQFNETWALKQNFRQTQTDNDKHHMYADWEADGRTLARTAVLDQNRLNQTLLDTHMQGKLNLGTTQHTVLLGVDWNHVKGSNTQRTGPAPSLDLLEPVYRVSIPEPTDLGTDYTQTTRQLGIYAQDQIKLDQRWVVTLGGRQDRVTTATDDRFNATNRSQSDNVFSGRAGLTYLVGNGLAPYASYAESFLPNSGVDINNQAFKPSQGKQVEVGLKYQPEGSNALFTAAVFDLNKTNVVTYEVPAEFHLPTGRTYAAFDCWSTCLLIQS